MRYMNYTKSERIVLLLACAYAFIFGIPRVAGAMHIMEGYLPLTHGIAWDVVCVPFLVAGFISIRRLVRNKKRVLILLAMSAAFIFVISSLKIPSVTGSCSHMTGTGLSAILFGVPVTSVLGIIVLIFQAILLAHGGLTTLGANTFSMAIVGPTLTWLLYMLGKKLRWNLRVNVFIAASLGCMFTYCVTALQLAFAYPSETGGVMASAVKFLGVFAPTQVPLAIVEGLLTVLVIIGMQNFARPELKELAFGEVK